MYFSVWTVRRNDVQLLFKKAFSFILRENALIAQAYVRAQQKPDGLDTYTYLY